MQPQRQQTGILAAQENRAAKTSPGIAKTPDVTERATVGTAAVFGQHPSGADFGLKPRQTFGQ
jgi:hypothetical protein